MPRKRTIIPCFRLLLLAFLLLPAGFLFAADDQPQYARSFQNGTTLYRESRWMEAAAEFRHAQEIAGNINDWSEALYWIIISELAAADYGSALRDMDELERGAPNSARSADIVYHRARAYYYLGYYEEALVTFNRFCGAADDGDLRKAAAFFWMGECLYSMGQLEKAEEFYNWILVRYPSSPKYEVSSYRIDLIKQKKIETELLTLLKWTHEEALRNSEDYQRRIRTFEQSFQMPVEGGDVYSLNMGLHQRLSEAEEEIRVLKEHLSFYENQRSPVELLDRAKTMRNDADISILENILGGSR